MHAYRLPLRRLRSLGLLFPGFRSEVQLHTLHLRRLRTALNKGYPQFHRPIRHFDQFSALDGRQLTMKRRDIGESSVTVEGPHADAGKRFGGRRTQSADA